MRNRAKTGTTYFADEEARKHVKGIPDHRIPCDFLAQPPGGESLVTAIERIYLFNSMLFRDRVGQKVFVVTHGGMIRCFRFLLEHWEYEQALKWSPGEAPQNCGLTVYQPNEQGRLVLREHNTVCWR